MRIAVVDSCFLINWSRFHQSADILRVFSKIVIPEPVLEEIEDVRAKKILATWIIENVVIIAPRLPSLNGMTLRIVSLSEIIPHLPRIDPPEAYCLCLAKERGYTVLTDNEATKRIKEILEEFREVEVMNSLDLLISLYGHERTLLEKKITRFMSETGIRFSRRRLEELGIELKDL